MISVVSMKVRCLHANRDVHIQFRFDRQGDYVYIFNEENCENEMGESNSTCKKCYEYIFASNKKIKTIAELSDMRAAGLCTFKP